MFGRKKLQYKTKWFFVSVESPARTLQQMNDFVAVKKARTHAYNAIKRDDGTLFPVSWYEEVEE